MLLDMEDASTILAILVARAPVYAQCRTPASRLDPSGAGASAGPLVFRIHAGDARVAALGNHASAQRLAWATKPFISN